MAKHGIHRYDVILCSMTGFTDKSSGGRMLKVVKKVVKAFHTRYRALGPELIPVYRQSARM